MGTYLFIFPERGRDRKSDIVGEHWNSTPQESDKIAIAKEE